MFEYLNSNSTVKNMSFIRKKSLNKKTSQQLQPNLTLLNSTSISQSTDLSVESSQKAKNHNPNETLQALKKLWVDINAGDLPFDSWQGSVASHLSTVVDLRKASGILVGQKLNLYKETVMLITKFQQGLKKKGTELCEKGHAASIGHFKLITDELVRITQEERNDEMVTNSQLTNCLFELLEALAVTSETELTKKDRKPSLMRKNSLKKVEELPAVRPLSRGKLSSLSKKDSSGNIVTSKKDILDIRPNSKNEERESRTPFQDVIYGLCCILKNLAANVKHRKQLLNEDYLRIVNRYLSIWNDKSNNPVGTAVMVQLTAFYRHLAVEEKSYKVFLKSNCFDAWCRQIEQFPTSNDLIFNLLRIISKLSSYESVCKKLNEKKNCLKTLSSFFKFYKSNIHIIIRVAFVFANMTSYLDDIRNQLYFDFKAWDDIFVCFDHYAGIELGAKSEVEKMGLSMAAWDYQAIKKESDIEAIIKIIRLIANLFTVSGIGEDIYINDSQSYREVIRRLKSLLEKKSNIEKSSELIACILSCLSNVLFYDRALLMSNPEYKTMKCQLTSILVDYVVQIDNEEICCEALRVVSNITRMKEFIRVVIEAKIHEAVLILLDSTCKDIVYYSLGILINLMADSEFKEQNKVFILNGVIEILQECEQTDFELVGVGLKTLTCLLEAGNENIDPETLTRVQNCLMNLGSYCDQAVMSSNEQSELGSVHESRSLINLLLNNMPEDKFVCPVKNCGRKFPDDSKLQEHVKRRHKLS